MDTDTDIHNPISIHTPAWGVTVTPGRNSQSIINFNPHTRVGCDTEDYSDITALIAFQSTHPRGV